MLPLLLRRCTGSSDIAGDCFVPQLKRAQDDRDGGVWACGAHGAAGLVCFNTVSIQKWRA
jgi:hypothetical protein